MPINLVGNAVHSNSLDLFATVLTSTDGEWCAVLSRNDDADRDMMVQKLRDGEYDALIMDSPSLEYIAATNTECDLFIIGGPLKSFSVHLAFAQGIDDQVVHDFSQSIIMSEVRLCS